MALKRRTDPSSASSKRILTMRDIQADITRLADEYNGPFIVFAACTGTAVLLGLLLMFLLPGWLKLLGGIILAAGLIVGGTWTLTAKQASRQLINIAEGLKKGNFSVFRDKITKCQTVIEKLGPLPIQKTVATTLHYSSPVNLPAFAAARAAVNDGVWLIRDAGTGTVPIAYLTAETDLDAKLSERVVSNEE